MGFWENGCRLGTRPSLRYARKTSFVLQGWPEKNRSTLDPLDQAMKKNISKRGRPPLARHTLPGWAIKRISQIARDAGASETRILELALQAGFIEIAELYKPLIAYAQNLAKQTLAPQRDEEPIDSFTESVAAPAQPDDELMEEYPIDSRGLGPAPEGGDQPELTNADERSGLGEEDETDLDLANPTADRFTPAGRSMTLKDQ